MAITSGQRPIPITTSSALTIIGSGDSGTTLTASLAFWTGSVIRSESLGWYKNSVASGTSSIYYTIQDSDNNSTLYYGQAAYNRLQTATAFSNTKSIQFLDFYALGTFTSYKSTQITRYARILGPSGSDDVTFNAQSGSNNTVYTGYQQSDGKLMLGGSFTTFSGSTARNLVRVNLDGTVDTSFDTGTGLSTNGTVYTAVTQSDGKILIGGSFTTYRGVARSNVARINTDGTIDTTFNTGTGPNSIVNCVIVQPDGKIILGGYFTSYSGSTANRIVRTNTDGTIDNTFVTGTGFDGTIFGMVLRSDGSIIAGGDAISYNGVYGNYGPFKLSSTGTADPNFPQQYYSGGSIRSMVLQPDGKLLVGNTGTNSYRGIRRYLANGTFDSTFVLGSADVNGLENRSVGVVSIAVQPDGKVLAGGDFRYYSGSVTRGVIRFSNSGALDTTLNTGAGFNSTVYKVLPLADGRIFVGGQYTQYNELGAKGVTLVDKAGNKKAGFNSGIGINYTSAGSSNEYILAAVKTNTGKIAALGYFGSYSGSRYNNLVQINSDGTGDSAFSSGQGFVNSSGGVYLNSMITQSNGNLLVGGQFTTYSSSYGANLVSINSDGTTDRTFNAAQGGPICTTGGVYGLLKQSDGKLVVTGKITGYGGRYTPGVVIITDSGSISSSFNTGTGVENAGAAGTVNGSAYQPDGKVILGGIFTSYSGSTVNNLVRTNADGTKDTSFNIGTGVNSTVNAVHVQTDGKILLGGSFTNYSGSSSPTMVRLNPDGTKDQTFIMGTGFNGPPSRIRQQSDGKIIVAGNFTTYSGSTARGICRLNLSGSLDTSYNSGTSFSNLVVYDLGLQSDDKVIAVGYFSSYAGVSSNEIVRINTDGSRDNTYNVGTGLTGFASYTFSVDILPDGKALVAHRHTTYSGSIANGLVRINTDGTKDNSFIVTSSIAQYTTLTQARQQPDGKMILAINGGYYSGSIRGNVIRVNQDGTVDESFKNPGFLTAPVGFGGKIKVLPNGSMLFAGPDITTVGTSSVSNVFRVDANGYVDNTFKAGAGLLSGSAIAYSTYQQSDGKILLGGSFSYYSGSGVSSSVRINPDGTRDTTFNPGVFSNNSVIYAITQQPDGKILLGGSFTNYSGSSANNIVRTNPDGTRDTTFNIGTGFNSEVRQIVVTPGEQIVVGGGFGTYSGSVCGSVVRLDLSGALDTSLDMPQYGLGVTNALIQK